MKKVLITFFTLLFTLAITAQSVDEIVKKHNEAVNNKAAENLKTMVINMKAWQAGNEILMTIMTKAPDKIRSVVSLMDIEIITLFDGVNGYMINPMTGSNAPIPVPPAEAAAMKEQNNFVSQVSTLHEKGVLELEGDANVTGRPAYRLKATTETGDPITLFIDKESYMLVRSDAAIAQMGSYLPTQTYMSDYTSYDGIMMPKNISIYSNGEEIMVMSIVSVDINKPLDDSLFSVK